MARTVKCPGCGADLTVRDDNRDFMFCEYCGTKVRLDDYQETHRYVNEAELRKIEVERELELKKMEMDEKKRQEEKEERPKEIIKLIFWIAAIIIIMILCEK